MSLEQKNSHLTLIVKNPDPEPPPLIFVIMPEKASMDDLARVSAEYEQDGYEPVLRYSHSKEPPNGPDTAS